MRLARLGPARFGPVRRLVAHIAAIAVLGSVATGVLLLGSRKLPTRPIRAASAAGAPGAKPQLVATYGKLPLSFEVNQGQADEQVKFVSRGRGYALFLTPTEAVLSLISPVE